MPPWENIFGAKAEAEGTLIPIGIDDDVTIDDERYCPPISNMVGMCRFVHPGSQHLWAMAYYAPNVAHQKGGFPAAIWRTRPTYLQYPRSILIIGPCTREWCMVEFHSLRLSMESLPFPVYAKGKEGDDISSYGPSQVISQVTSLLSSSFFLM